MWKNTNHRGSVLFLILDIWSLLWYNKGINAERINIVNG